MTGHMASPLPISGTYLPHLKPPTPKPNFELTSRSGMTDVYEGSLIRVFRRLEECLRQMAQASKVMGSEDLESKFEEALTKVRRDIVAAQSLYL